MNGISVVGDKVGETLYYGPGAGGDATASAVVADIIDTVRSIDVPADQKVPLLGFRADSMRDTPVLPIEDTETSYYLRMSAEDKPGVLAEVSEVFAAHSISLEAVLQKEPNEGEGTVTLVLLSQQVQEKNMNAAIKEVEALSAIQGKVVRIRMEHLG